MRAFGHIVAINEDFETIAHVHPMGKKLLSPSERGGPELTFHFVPKKAGFYKIWIQIQIDKKDIYVPFGIKVNS